MTRKLIGLVASVALMGSSVAMAGDTWKKGDPAGKSQDSIGAVGRDQDTSLSKDKALDAIGGSGQSGTGQQLTGRVVKSDSKTVWVEHAGAIVPLKIDKSTQFTDTSLKRAKDFKQGDEIRASFEVKNTDNVATSIGMANTGTGGSGEVQFPAQDTNALPPAPLDDGTGGNPLTPPDVSQQGTGSDLGTDIGVNQGSRNGNY
ncbi:hypothetical protein POL68_39975 [Stigmatella sp. ncwal1]|uniref:DUF5666 domain-containing protein n=1 Tax=Stigmatella ashevillensis TaxID=2995309 RepID=A0ABT5DMD7_9BACT|nr:hypothetical protein [Stigmatella ashevillena]MDC0714696.1 hypothetical protein [Stigmatella ashevillena]